VSDASVLIECHDAIEDRAQGLLGQTADANALQMAAREVRPSEFNLRQEVEADVHPPPC
jgi:hypothetical protein